MDKEQKERLEQELRFLKESLEADVISEEEYEKGKQRIENKLKELEEQDETPKEIAEETPEEKVEITELKEETPKREEEKAEKLEAKKVELWVGEKEEKPVEKEREERKEEEPEEEIIVPKKWLYVIGVIIVLIFLFFSIKSYKKTLPEKPLIETKEETLICSSDSDCRQEGKIGTCINPNTKEAKCEFKEDTEAELIIINDKDCYLCDSSRMKEVIKEIFPNIKIKDMDYSTAEAKRLISKLNINALPAYVFDFNITKTTKFEDFERALTKKENNYILSNTASGANYYFKRIQSNNKLDLFLTPDIEEKADTNLKEFLDLFKNNINFTKHMVTENEKANLKDELGITSYPVFLINNQFKFSGLHSANSIKEKFCKLNKLDQCKKELRKNII